MRIRPLFFASLLAATIPASLQGGDKDLFEKKIRPLLLTHCVECHGPAKQKGGLRLDSQAMMAKGGDSGAVVKPGDPAASLIVTLTRYDGDVKMPPRGKMSDEEIAVLAEWVKAGAAWPKDAVLAAEGTTTKVKPFDLSARAKSLWSFQPVKSVAPPKIDVAHPIDAFLREKLLAVGLEPAPLADRRTLIRRLTFDLLGLPPSPEEIAAFERDESPSAYEKLVDRLLASPHYGERWARHWLDLVRYAETCGHEFDFEIPNAWRYRDYVVRAMNADLPYDQFLREHIAGDILETPRTHPKDHSNESIQATGFWFFHEAKHSPVDSRADYSDRIDNQIDVFGKAVLGLTLACARCHDHKFDPVSTKDYYSLFGVLTSSRYQQAFIDDLAPSVKILEEMKTLLVKSKSSDVKPGGSTSQGSLHIGPDWRKHWFATGLGLRPTESDAYPHTGRESVKLAAALRSPTFLIEGPSLAIRVAGQNAKARIVLNGLEQIRSPIYGGLSFPINDGSALKWHVFDLKMWQGQPAYLELLDDGPGYFAITEIRWGPVREKSKDEVPAPPGTDIADAKAAARFRELEAALPTARRTPAMADGNGRNERVFVRGSHKNLGEEVPRRYLEAFQAAPFATTGSGRLELASALTDLANPLVSRVMVNRLWKHHFTEGLVRSPDDFGVQGQPPTHPELLDFLATEFIARGWSLKAMHRLMVTSHAYRQSSRATPEMAAKAVTLDPQNRLLHKQHVRRLEAEAIRDALLSVSGRLDRTMEGPGVLPFLSDHISGRGRPASGPLDGNGRRSLYLQVRRNFLNPMFVAFDYPTPFSAIGRRSVSNVPAQALSMLNNPFVIQQADLWAKSVLAADVTDADRLRSMYLVAFGRAPSRTESEAGLKFVREADAVDRKQAWADLAHVLLNTKEFLLVE